jgi:ABC-type ATPase involved in cell division
MLIERIKISNFKRISELTVDLGEITYLVGGNNSGKSSVLQAIHMAVSCAERSAELQQQVVAESSLRYCPTGEFERLGNSGPYENRKDGSRGAIEFFGKTSDAADASYKVELYKAKNYHNVGVERSGVYNGFGQPICDPRNLFSVYVPGLSGIPHQEEMQSYSSVFKRAAGGEANLVFRNIVRLISERGDLRELETQLFDIVGPCKFSVKFDSAQDLYVDVKVSFQDPPQENSFVPIDLSGTGVIQVTQILAYVILFRPKLLLVDEPDSHLHPSRQVLLSQAFEKIASRYGCKIIVSTHSRHLVSSAPDGTKIVWLRNGEIESQGDNGLINILLDLGALDQIDSRGADFLVCTEDRGRKQLEMCIEVLDLAGPIKTLSYNGVTNASSAAVIQAMAALFPKVPQILIHRDRDFLTDDEVRTWGEEYRNRGMQVFCPRLADIESYFVTDAHVSRVYETPVDIVQQHMNEIRTIISAQMRNKFVEKRREAILKFWRDGGGPATDDLWPPDTPMQPEMILGKLLLPRINEEMPRRLGQRRNLLAVPSEELVGEFGAFVATLH